MDSKNELQSRIIRDPRNINETLIPEMPLLIALENGVLGEANSLGGAVAIVIGEEYLDSEDSKDTYLYRLKAARKESMKAIQRGAFVKVYDSVVGELSNNYAAEKGDPDYEEENEPPIYIRISSEKLFLLSLLQTNSIVIYEREDSYLLRGKTSSKDEIPRNYKGGTYIELSKEYDIEELINAAENEII